MAKNLTTLSVERQKPDPTKRLEIPDGLTAGLYLVVQPSGAKSWAVRYRRHDKPKKLTLGKWPAIGLPAARGLAQTALRTVAEGGDPAAEKQDRREPDTVASVIDDYMKRHAKRNTRSWKETERLFKLYLTPKYRSRAIAEFGRRDVRDIVDAVEDAGKPVQANRVLTAIHALLNWAVERDVIEANPAAGIKRPTKEVARDRVLDDAEIRAVWRATASLSYPADAFVKLLILTGARRDEIREMRWSEIDQETWIWTLPADRSKNGQAHIVPLPDQAVAVLQAVARFKGCDFVLTTDGERPYQNVQRPKTKLDKVSKVTGWVWHDVRRSAATGMGNLGIAGETIARCLNHVERQIAGVTARYARADHTEAKRRAFQAWADHVEGVVTAGNVVALSR